MFEIEHSSFIFKTQNNKIISFCISIRNLSKMKKLTLIFVILLCTLFAASCKRQANSNASGVSVTDAQGQTVVISDTSRIVTVGTSVTESIYTLGANSKLVGTDNSSHEYIAETKPLPTVGSLRALSAEGLLSLKPTLLITTADAGPNEVLAQLKAANVAVLTLPTNYSVEDVKTRIKTIAHALSLDAKGEDIANNIDKEMADVNALLQKATSKPKVIFCGRGPNAPNATMSGKKTTINEMINLAGGVNPITEFEGFKPMTDEAVVAAQPDAILITERSFERSGGVDGVLKFPGVALTPAGKNRRIIPVSDMYFQGFGPGLGKAVRELVLKFHPEIKQ